MFKNISSHIRFHSIAHHVSVIDHKIVTSKFYNYRRDLFHRFLLLKLCHYNTSRVLLIAAKSQHMIDVFLCKRKSEESYTLRFIYEVDLLLFRGEQSCIKQGYLRSSLGLLLDI